MRVLASFTVLISVFFLGVYWSDSVKQFGRDFFFGNLADTRIDSDALSEEYERERRQPSKRETGARVLASKQLQGQFSQKPDAEKGFSWSRVKTAIDRREYALAISMLERFLSDNPASSQAWATLASVYERQGRKLLAVDAWLKVIEFETDPDRIESIVGTLKQYFLGPALANSVFGDDSSWAIEKLQSLSDIMSNDGELHWMLASLYLNEGDDYQAQYHALMAATDPRSQERAEKLLAELNGESFPDKLSIPLIAYGNQYLVKVNIEGNSGTLLLDTGASISGVSQSFVNRFPSIVKDTKPIMLNTASGAQESYLFTVYNLNIDPLNFQNHILAMLPMASGTKFDGLLGVDILGRFDFVIDHDALQLHLEPRS